MSKKIFILISLILVFALSGCTTFQKEQKPVKISDDREFVRVLEDYQVEKSETDLDAIINYLETSGLLSEPAYMSPLQGFFIGILLTDKEKFISLNNTIKKPALKTVFKVAKTSANEMENILSENQTYYPETLEFLDSLWGYYYATGDDRVIKKICKIKERDIDAEIRAAAKWSLKSHIEKFPTKIKGCN